MSEDAVAQQFVGTMKVGEALRNHPKAKEMMANFHLGGCSACSMSEQETLEEVCQGYGVKMDQLLKALNGLLES
jgi:hybrid cluster-associated redox disulfide protein